jgi:Transposase, Mutator family
MTQPGRVRGLGQRCRVHFLRTVLARVPKGSAEMVAAATKVEITSFPSPSTPTRTGEVCSPAPDLRVMSTARWLLATNSRASSGWPRRVQPAGWGIQRQVQ